MVQLKLKHAVLCSPQVYKVILCMLQNLHTRGQLDTAFQLFNLFTSANNTYKHLYSFLILPGWVLL